MSIPEARRRRVTRRTFLLAGLAVAAVLATGCGSLPDLLTHEPGELVYRSQVAPRAQLDEAVFGTTRDAFERRLRFVGFETAAVRPVRDPAGAFFLVEVPATEAPHVDSLILRTGVLSLVALPDDAAVGDPPPAGAVPIVANLRVAQVTFGADSNGDRTLEFALTDRDAPALAKATEKLDKQLGIVVDGIVVLAAEVNSPIPDGRVSIAGPNEPRVILALGALLASGPLGSDLVVADGGQIGFDK